MAVDNPTVPEETHPPTIRVCSVHDADALAQIGAATFLETYAGLLPGRDVLMHCRRHHTPEAYRELLLEPATAAWIVEAREAPVGYAMITRPDLPPELWTDQDMELKRFYLFSRLRGTGLAQRLLADIKMHLAERNCRNLLVGLYEENGRALSFYRRSGFNEAGRRAFKMGDCVFDDPVLRLEL